MKVSIIVPVFNTEAYVGQCIESLINQSYRNIEIIIVDDGSIDDSVSKIKSFMKDDDRIKLIQQKNSGAFKARLKGIEEATGDAILFIDSDDYIDLKTIDILVKEMNKSKCDAVHFEQTKDLFNNIINKREILYNNDIRMMLLTSKRLNSLCSALYKKELFDDINKVHNDYSYAEDYLMNLNSISEAKKVLFIDSKLYYVRTNSNSTTRNKNIKQQVVNFEQFINVYSTLFDYLKKWDLDIKDNYNKVSYYILDSTRQYIYVMMRNNKLSKKRFVSILDDLLDNKTYNNIRLNYKRKFYISMFDFNNRVINYILDKKYSKIWNLRILLKIKDFIKGD
jgi:glycosyltransferase involved in cell wall biosynthesis